MTGAIDPVRLATIRNNHAHAQRQGVEGRFQADNEDLGDLLAEVDRLRALLAEVGVHLAVIHRHASRHDVLAANLGCAGCELLARIEGAEPEPDRVPLRTPTPGRTDAHFSPGYTGEIPDHAGVFETRPLPACAASRRQQEAGS